MNKNSFEEDDNPLSATSPKKKMNMSVLPNIYTPKIVDNYNQNDRNSNEESIKTKNNYNLARSVIPGAGQLFGSSKKSNT
jgi:hypothetical protein